MNLTQKIIGSHLVSGTMTPGSEIGLRIDQTLTQDATGTMAWLQFEALGIPRVKTDISLSYVDHNTLQMNFRNPDDHRFLRTVAAKFGGVYSGPGTGICHQLHLENFAKPGATLVGSDSHTPTAGGICSLAMGAGGLSVALAMAGEPYYIPMPKVVRVFLTGALTGWASAKDVILELLRRRTVKGGVGRVFEYAGPGVATLSVPERATIANMGAELGATGTLFPSDGVTRAFLKAMGREADWRELGPDADAAYDEEEAIDLSALVPLAAQPHMPDRVVPVAELDGLPVEQVCIGSCTNSSYADLKLVAQILDGHRINPGTDAMISPGSKQVLTMLAQEGLLEPLIGSGARLLECSCGPCIGSGGAPVTSGVSARTFNRNFEGRSGTKDAKVYLVSPLTAAQAALNGKFTDPATWGTPPAKPELPADPPSIRHLFVFPPENGDGVEVLRGPNAGEIPPPRRVRRRARSQRRDPPRRQHHHRPHHARGRGNPRPALQYPGHFRARVRARGPRFREARPRRLRSGRQRRHRGWRKLWSGLQPRTRGAGPAPSRHQSRHRPVDGPHPPRQSREFRHSAPSLREQGRLC